MEIKQLLLSKYLFLKGQDVLDQYNAMACGLAISHFQDSVEILMWTIAKECNISFKGQPSFENLWNRVDDYLRKSRNAELQFKAKMQELNKARVNFKHYGNLPDPSDAHKFLPYTQEFLTSTMKLIFDVSFESVTLSELIQNRQIGEIVKKAETYLAHGQLSECITECAKAEYLISNMLKEVFPEVDSGISNIAYLFEQDKAYGVENIFQYLREYLNALRSFLIVVMLGISLTDYKKFKNIVPIVFQMRNQSWQIRRKVNKYSKYDANFVLRYILNYAIRMQDRIKVRT